MTTGWRMESDTYSAERAGFAERLGRLAGETTYRVPVEGRSTRHASVPEPHALATALAYARRSRDDVGPDMAYDMVLGRATYRVRIVRSVAAAMMSYRGQGSRCIARWPQWVNQACHIAYGELLGFRAVRGPLAVPDDDWSMLVESAKRIMLILADDAVAHAERAYHCAA